MFKQTEEKAEEFINKNDEDINNVTFNKAFENIDPLGGISVVGFVNNDNKLTFNIKFRIVDEKVEQVTSIVKPKNFLDEKEECEDKFCQ